MKRRKVGRYGGYVPRPNKMAMGLSMNTLNTTRILTYSNQAYTPLSFASATDFSLSYLSSPGDFTNLFDVHKIWKVEITFIPKYNSSDFSSGGSAYGLPTIYIAEDRNDKTVPATVNELREYATCKARRFDKPVKYTCWPSLSIVGDGDANIVDSRQKDYWCRNAAAKANGCKWALDLPLGLETFRMDVVQKYFITCKDIK